MALRALLWLSAAVASSHGAVLTSRLGGTRVATPLRRMSGPVLSVKEGDHIVRSSTTNLRLSPTASHCLSHTATHARARTALDVNSLEKGIPRFRSPEDIH
eukprot:scaffold8845_cov55-Phaeocystis_antarctica.AAC.3